ncbi:MAG: hypothetical protein CM1200mP41_08530 [Gammaproteobacteria bacterium]|nr:MAG: hypothetical protein CM1200mP41_08530 [Gammaproteobacteria bacterium]
MATDFSLIAHTAERHAKNFGFGWHEHRFPNEVLPTPGGPTRQRIGPSIASLVVNSKVLKNSFFDFLKGHSDLLPVFFLLYVGLSIHATLLPGHLHQPVNIVANHGSFGRHW